MDEKLKQICEAFCIKGTYLGFDEIKVGNVNRTYRVNFRSEDGTEKAYILQKVNTYVFKKPVEVMDNIDLVTSHIRERAPEKQALHFHHTKDRKNYLFDDGFWRLFNYIPSVSYNVTENLHIIRAAGEAFGEFQMLLADFDAAKLHETIPNFHNTKQRYAKLIADAKLDPKGRLCEVQDEYNWLIGVKDKACRLTELYEAGELPLRVTHNDTKINNVLFDAETDEALAVIDLDTVMPGLVAHDFGDAVRFAANFVEEDCPDFSKAGVNLNIFRAFAEGFLHQTAKTLSEKEIETLSLGAFVLACELAVRFLDDYILGDPYFKIDYPQHNLVRTRCQIALAKDMLDKMQDMETCVKSCAASAREEPQRETAKI